MHALTGAPAETKSAEQGLHPESSDLICAYQVKVLVMQTLNPEHDVSICES